MITNSGKDAFGRILARSQEAYVAVGIGLSAPVATDKQLDFEVVRASVVSSVYNAADKIIVYKATIPSELDFYMSEVGLIFSGNAANTGGMLASFEQDIEPWSGGTWVTDDVLVGSSGLQLLAQTAVRGDEEGGSTNLRNSDTVQVAYFGVGGSVEVRLENSSTEYLSFTFPVQAGHSVAAANVRDMTRTGDVNLNSLNTIRIIHTGTGGLTLDAMRVSTDTEEENLVVRQVLPQPYRKVAGMPMDIEVPVEVGL